MEPDRYQYNRVLFIVSLTSLLICLSLFGFFLYILPYLIWQWNYNVPEFLLDWQVWFQKYYLVTESQAKRMVLLTCFIPALLAGLVSYITSNIIERGIYNKELPLHAPKNHEALRFSLRLILINAGVVMFILFIVWLFSS